MKDGGKKKCIYDAVMLRGLTCGSGFAAVSIAGIIQYYLKKIRGYGRGDKCACRLSSDEYTVVKRSPQLGAKMYGRCVHSCPALNDSLKYIEL